MSTTVNVARVQVDDKDINQLQNNIINSLQPMGQKINLVTTAVNSFPLIGGKLYSASLSTSPTRISQTLGKVPTGWIVTDVDANVEIHRTSWDVNSITLMATGNCNVSLYIF